MNDNNINMKNRMNKFKNENTNENIDKNIKSGEDIEMNEHGK